MIIKFNYINSKGNAEGAFIAYPHPLEHTYKYTITA